jgi:hypothetical protein
MVLNVVCKKNMLSENSSFSKTNIPQVKFKPLMFFFQIHKPVCKKASDWFNGTSIKRTQSILSLQTALWISSWTLHRIRIYYGTDESRICLKAVF